MNKYFVAMAPPQVLAMTVPLEVGRGLIVPGVTEQTRNVLVARVAKNGKFQKSSVFYMPYSFVPPGAYCYQCRNCTFYQSGKQTCEVVDDIVQPYSWCGLWLPLVDEKPYTWGEDQNIVEAFTPVITQLQGM